MTKRIAMLVCWCALLAACGQGGDRDAPASPAKQTASLKRKEADLALRSSSAIQTNLSGPAHRIVALAPNITELVYAAGAGQYLVATTAYSDYPPQAKSLPQVG